jgi:hypothetical protein
VLNHTFTLEAWVRAEKAGTIFSINKAGASGYGAMVFEVLQANAVGFSYKPKSFTLTSTNNGFATNKWAYLAVKASWD